METDWVQDPRFATIEARKENEDDLDQLIEARCMEFDREPLVERLVAGDILTAPINNIPEVTQDPQIHHNEMLVEAEHARLGAMWVTGVPIKFYGTPGRVRRAPPMLGQHTSEVLEELGFSEEEVEALAAQDVVGTRQRIEERASRKRSGR